PVGLPAETSYPPCNPVELTVPYSLAEAGNFGGLCGPVPNEERQAYPAGAARHSIPPSVKPLLTPAARVAQRNDCLPARRHVECSQQSICAARCVLPDVRDSFGAKHLQSRMGTEPGMPGRRGIKPPS